MYLYGSAHIILDMKSLILILLMLYLSGCIGQDTFVKVIDKEETRVGY